MYVLRKNDIVDFVNHARITQHEKQAFGYTAAKQCRGGSKLFQLAKAEGFLLALPSPIAHIPVYYAYNVSNDDREVVDTLWRQYRAGLSPRALKQIENVKVTKKSSGVIARLNRIERKLDEILAAAPTGE